MSDAIDCRKHASQSCIVARAYRALHIIPAFYKPGAGNAAWLTLGVRNMGFGVNVKAQEGRARKVAQKEARKRDDDRKREEKEEKEWQAGAKQASSKRVEDEARRAAKEQAKQERKRIEAEEAREFEKYKKVVPTKTAQPTPTSAVRDATTDAGPSRPTTSDTDVLSQNPVYSASGIDDALLLIETATGAAKGAPLERHPERRVKAAYAAFEEREMPLLKANNPGLRLSQLRERLQRMWAKSPENPFNQAYISHRATKTQEELHAEKVIEERLERMRLNPQ